MRRPLNALCVHAHCDDFELGCGGTFELWKRKLGPDARRRVIVCTDGAAGHHSRSREETREMRRKEQLASAALGGYEVEFLRLPDGTLPREGGLAVTPPVLAALWKAVRDFQPDYLFCPPVVADPLAGIHVDHQAVAELVRNVAYLVAAPHAFTPEFPAEEDGSRFVKVPVILTCYDNYQAGTGGFDFCVDVGEVFDAVAEMSFCHRSQVVEWLPWVSRKAAPTSSSEWKERLNARYERVRRTLNIPGERKVEPFTVTAWGSIPDYGDILDDVPNIVQEISFLDRLKERLERWKG